MARHRAWIFQATPRSRDIAAELGAGDTLSWSVARYGRELQPGDRVYYWQSGRDAGIYGVGRVTLVSTRQPDGRYAVQTGHERALFAPITRAELRADPTLRDLAVLRQPRGTVFPLSSAHELALARRLGAGALLLGVPIARRQAGTIRLIPDMDGDLAERVEDMYARGEEVIVALHDAGEVVESGRVGAVRRRRDGTLALRLRYLDAEAARDLPRELLAQDGNPDAVVALSWPARPEPDPALPRRVAEPPAAYRLAPRFAPTPAEVSSDLVLPPALVDQLVAAVNAGRHIVLMGLPGTGKTTLALNLAYAATRAGLCAGPLLATATADWSTFDTVGGLMPGPDGALRFAEGVALRALRENRWLVLDELNRADIDKAFGPLLTVVSGGPVELPTVTVGGLPVRIEPGPGAAALSADGAAYHAGAEWRIVATMNTLDRAALFSFSLAFARRFAFILVPPPQPEALLELIRRRVTPDEAAMALLHRLIAVTPRPLGPAILLDAARYIVARADAGALAEAVGALILPQLEGLDHTALAAFVAALAPALGPSGDVALRAYVEALYGDGR